MPDTMGSSQNRIDVVVWKLKMERLLIAVGKRSTDFGSVRFKLAFVFFRHKFSPSKAVDPKSQMSQESDLKNTRPFPDVLEVGIHYFTDNRIVKIVDRHPCVDN